MSIEAGEGYCIRCKRGVQLKERAFGRYANNMPVERGKCVNCGSKVTRMLSKAEASQYQLAEEIEKQI